MLAIPVARGKERRRPGGSEGQGEFGLVDDLGGIELPDSVGFRGCSRFSTVGIFHLLVFVVVFELGCSLEMGAAEVSVDAACEGEFGVEAVACLPLCAALVAELSAADTSGRSVSLAW